MFENTTNDVTKSIDTVLTEMEQVENETLKALNENSDVRFKVKKDIILKRAAARRAILIAKANSDPLFDRYVAQAATLREIRAKILTRYGNKAKEITRRNMTN